MSEDTPLRVLKQLALCGGKYWSYESVFQRRLWNPAPRPPLTRLPHTLCLDFDMQLELVQLLIGTLLKEKERRGLAVAAFDGTPNDLQLIDSFAGIRSSFFQSDATKFLLHLNTAPSSRLVFVMSGELSYWCRWSWRGPLASNSCLLHIISPTPVFVAWSAAG